MTEPRAYSGNRLSKRLSKDSADNGYPEKTDATENNKRY